jgi:KaiC/GvpD/RAD55 family RecA-like ATPase
MSAIERVPTGIPGLDQMIEGGIPAGRSVLVMGGPGSGKSVFCAQFLHHGISKLAQKGIYVSLEEDRYHFYREMSRFGWDLEKEEREGNLKFLDATPSFEQETAQPHSLEQILHTVSRLTRDLQARRVAVDAIASLVFEFPDLLERRKAILRLIHTLCELGVTSILTNELRTLETERPVQLEEYLTHGTILLQSAKSGPSLVRSLQVEKMRETAIDPQPRPYRITSSGIEVFAKESVI